MTEKERVLLPEVRAYANDAKYDRFIIYYFLLLRFPGVG